MFRNAGDALEIIVTPIAEMRRSETKEDSDRATVATLVFQVVCSMLGTQLSLRNITTPSTDEFFWVKMWLNLYVTSSISSKISLKQSPFP